MTDTPVRLVTAEELEAHPELELVRPEPIPRGPSAGLYAVRDTAGDDVVASIPGDA